MKKYILLIIIGLFVISCAPPQYKPYIPEPIKFETTPPYSIQDDLENVSKAIKEAGPPKKMYVKQIDETTFKLVENSKEATHIMLAPKEFAKVGAVVKLAKTYKKVILNQEMLINLEIQIQNRLKEFAALEQKKFRSAMESTAISENKYRYEAYQHKVDNVIHKTTLGGIGIGAMVLLLLLL